MISVAVSSKKLRKTLGRRLVIVESPTKAVKIQQILGEQYTVMSCKGHIRDLPKKGMGVDVDAGFRAKYVISERSVETLDEIRSVLPGADELFLATDADREGEAIAWHLQQVLAPKIPVRRVTFRQITTDAILAAFAQPREVNLALVEAQETRRILDRLVGYELSPVLIRRIKKGLSAGRVQSVALHMLVARERERMAFRSGTWWDLRMSWSTSQADSQTYTANLVESSGARLACGSDFDGTSGKLVASGVLHLDENAASQLRTSLLEASFTVVSCEHKPRSVSAKPAFSTSSLQQTANNSLGFTASRTMMAAQELYEKGLITYMRTDSTLLPVEAVEALRGHIEKRYGTEYLSSRTAKSRSKTLHAQEAHEGIRPVNIEVAPDAAGRPRHSDTDDDSTLLSDDARKLYSLIWSRTMASEMADARLLHTKVTIAGDIGSAMPAVFAASGKTVAFAGWRKAYASAVAISSDGESTDSDAVLPPLSVGDIVTCKAMSEIGHETAPPARLTEATLTERMEAAGIGRPSTYASTIETLLARGYYEERGRAMVPTWQGFAVTQLLEKHLPAFIDHDFTARMEADLDRISEGKLTGVDFLTPFYLGGEKPGLRTLVKAVLATVHPREASSVVVHPRGGSSQPMVIRIGQYGPFVEFPHKTVKLPPVSVIAPDELTAQRLEELLADILRAQQPLGMCPETGMLIYIKGGPYGPYIQRGENEDAHKKITSIPKAMSVDSIDFHVAIELLKLPRTLGLHPVTGTPVVAKSGPFGPYVACGEETRKLKNSTSPLSISLDEAISLLAEPRAPRVARGNRRNARRQAS